MSDPARARHRLGNTAWIILISLTMAGASLFGLETYLSRQPTDLRFVDYDEMVPVWHHRPNLDLVVRPPPGVSDGEAAASDRTVHFRTDARGFIEPAGDRRTSEVVIAFLGGSSTENFWLAEPLRFAARATEMLSQRTGRRVGAWNAGYPGTTAMDSVSKLLHLIAPMRPDIAVMMHGINDAGALLRYGDYLRDGRPRGLKNRHARGWTASIKAVIRHTLPHTMVAFSDTGRQARRTLFGEPEAPAQWLDEDAQSGLSDREIVAKLVSRFDRQLGLFIDICRQYGIQPVLMTQAHRLASSEEPFAFPPGPQGWSSDYTRIIDKLHEALQDSTRTIAAARNIALVDLEKQIPGRRALLWDQVHMTNAGARMAAAVIAAHLAPMIKAR